MTPIAPGSLVRLSASFDASGLSSLLLRSEPGPDGPTRGPHFSKRHCGLVLASARSWAGQWWCLVTFAGESGDVALGWLAEPWLRVA